MAKRIYFESIKKWAIKAGIPVGITTFSLIFIYLIFLELIVVSNYSGDMVCSGTLEDPCLAFINFTVKEDIFIYPIEYDPYGRDTPFETDKGLKSWKMYRSWGNGWREIKLNQTCTATWCGAPPKSPNNKYSFAFRENRDYEIKIEAYKESPDETIKWGFGPVDPFWYGTPTIDYTSNVSTILMELGSQVNISANITGAKVVFVDIDHPDYGIEYASGTPSAEFLFNITYMRDNEFNDSSTSKTYELVPANYTLYVASHQYDNLINLSINITGSINNATYPKLQIYVNNTLSNDLGWVYNETTILNEFNDSTTSKNFYFNTSQTGRSYFNIFKTVSISNVTFDVTAFNASNGFVYDDFEDASFNLSEWTRWNYSIHGGSYINLSEESGYLRMFAWGGNDLLAESRIWINSTNITTNKDIDTLSINISLNHKGDSGEASLIIFNKTIKNVSSVTGLSVNSTWKLERNTTDHDYFVYYENGTIKGNFLPNGTDISFFAAGLQNDIATIYIYEVNYTIKNTTYDPSIEIGSADGIHEWNKTGIYWSSEKTNNLNVSVASYLSTCTADSDGFCDVPIYVTSGSSGGLTIDEINISYEVNPNPVYLSSSIINNFLGNSSGSADIPIRVESFSNGTITLDDIRFDHYGGNDTIDVLVYEALVFSWWNSTWDKRKEVNITGGAGTLSNFTVLLNVSYDSNMLTSFHDLRFIENACNDTQDTELDFEFDTVAIGNYSLVWLKIPSLTTGTNQICMYYNNSGASSGEDRANAWDSNYKGIWHFKAGTGTTANDSIGAGNGDGNASYADLAWIAGRIGQATSLDGTDDYLDIDPNTGINLTDAPMTIEAWTYWEGSADADVILSCVGANGYYYTINGAVDKLEFGKLTASGTNISDDSMVTDSWQYLSVVYSASDYVEFRKNKTADSGNPHSQALTFTALTYRIAEDAGGHKFKGNLDEIRVSNTARSSDWINRSYDNIDFDIVTFESEVDYDDAALVKNYSTNRSLSLINYYSGWNYEFPRYIDYIEFIPETSSSLNVTPFGQTNNKPILNLTTYNYGGKNMNLSIYLNESHSCVNITYGTDSNRSETVAAYHYYDDFESGWGNWSNVPYDDDNWSGGTSTPSSDTGPQSGGVGGAGTYFIYVETSNGYCYTDGEEAIIWMSDAINFDLSSNDQISWYNNFYGVDIGNLSLQENTTGSWVTKWEQGGEVGTDWFKNITSLSSLSGIGNLRFNYSCAGGFHGDVAMDRINVTTTIGTFQKLNQSWKNIDTDLEYLTKTPIWLWADYNCSFYNWSLFYPHIYIKGCCIGCTCSEDLE